MESIIKTEICENVPLSKAPVSFQAIISDMKIFETASNRKVSKLETRLQEAEVLIDNLQKEKEELKSSLAAKERDCKLYYSQYQNIAREFEDFKENLNKESKKSVGEQVELQENSEIESAIIVDDSSEDDSTDNGSSNYDTSDGIILVNDSSDDDSSEDNSDPNNSDDNDAIEKSFGIEKMFHRECPGTFQPLQIDKLYLKHLTPRMTS